MDADLAHATWATTSPYVVECLRAAGRSVLCLDGKVSQEDADRVGYMALRAARRIERHLDGVCTDWPPGISLGSAVVHSAHRLLTSLFYKALLLDRLLANTPEGARTIVVGQDSLSPANGFELIPNRFDTLFAVLGRRLGLGFIPFDAPRPSGALVSGDFLRPSLWTRAVTAINAPVFAPLFRAWLQVWGGRRLRLVRGRGNLHVVIYGSNELIEEIFAHLLLQGATVHQAPAFTPAGDLLEESAALSIGDLSETVSAICRKEAALCGLSCGPAFAVAAEISAERITAALAQGRRAADHVADYCADVKRRCSDGPIVILTDGLGKPAERLLQQGFARAGIPVYTVDHGVGPGLDHLHKAVYDNGLAPEVRGAITYTECRQIAECAASGAPLGASAVVGVPQVIRKIGLRSLQRRVVRRVLAVRKKRLIVWTTALYPNNYQFLPHYWRDTSYHALRKRIVYDILGRCDDDVLLKLYPTYRYVDPDPFAGLLELPPNCRQIQFTDFRNLRAAADVLILDAPGSVLGWAWSADVPQIYIETGMCPLLPEIAERFQESLFYVDVRDAGWEDRLWGFLALPHRELVARYDAKAARRLETERFCILGPEGKAGKRAAAFIFASAADRAGTQHPAIAATP